jgi:hypothetical protein
MHAIRITAVPPGEAPLEIRQAWVGLVLPVSENRRQSKQIPLAGVKSGPKTFWGMLWSQLTFQFARTEGYEVDVLAAIEVLEKTNPGAAAWWRQNTPHMMHKWRRFGFPAECCELADARLSQRP